MFINTNLVYTWYRIVVIAALYKRINITNGLFAWKSTRWNSRSMSMMESRMDIYISSVYTLDAFPIQFIWYNKLSLYKFKYITLRITFFQMHTEHIFGKLNRLSALSARTVCWKMNGTIVFGCKHEWNGMVWNETEITCIHEHLPVDNIYQY